MNEEGGLKISVGKIWLIGNRRGTIVISLPLFVQALEVSPYCPHNSDHTIAQWGDTVVHD